ncbi:hypothetical protein LVY74_02325 [Acinetobacter sp. ME22]|uniref:hypothetical protein n=1 Tax=Acinetobacter sp. ME22 TaxID=2904802 RepID=UPI001EDBF689|nr:hypothetical protein [Acinetobacter sp. ME22]MCG2572394.1 hypothetical protein [Acinetobacter sp. ME22]
MNRLDLCPLQASYSVQFGCSVQRDQLPGGFSRYSTVTESKKHLVSLAFKVTEMDYLYFRAFYLNWQLNPLPFLMKLFIEDSQYKDYICQFVPDSFNFAELNGRIFNVSAQLLVVISPVIALTSRMYPFRFVEGLVTAFALTDGVQREVMNLTDADVESVETAFTLTEATIRSAIALYPDPDNRSGNGETGGGDQAAIECININFAVTAATIRSAINTVSVNESVTTAMALTAATQRAALLSNTMLPESIQTGFALTGAQITN